MALSLLAFLRKMAIGGLVVLSVGCLAAVFGSRLPDQEICVTLYHYSASQTEDSGELIFDTTTGRSAPETRDSVAPMSLTAPNSKTYVVFEPVATERYDIYLRSTDNQFEPRLLQHSVWMSAIDLSSFSDQYRWSHDSSKVAFLWLNDSKDKIVHLTVASVNSNQIMTVSPFANDTSKIFHAYVQEWSADNHYFSVIEQVVSDSHYSVWDAETVEAVPFPLGANAMMRGVWSPQDHTFAAILRDEHLKPTHLIILNPDQNNTVIQAPLPPINIQHLMWSPDGKALVIGYLACDTANCHQQWHYDLFQANGTPLASDLTGSLLNSTIPGGTQYSTDGRTIYSGYPFNAVWSSDSKRFIYLEPTTSGDNPTYSIGVYDVDKQQALTLATYPAVNFHNSFFRTFQYRLSSNRIWEAVPYVPLSDQMIIPYQENGKINVILTGDNLQKPIELVHQADQLYALPNTFWQGQYWTTDLFGNSHILIEWSTGQGKDKHYKLTTADATGNHIITIDEDLDDISNMDYIYDEEQPLIGFMGKKGARYDLYTLNLSTGKQMLALENVEDNGGWEVAFNPQHTWMTVRSNIIQPGGGQLFIRSAENNSLIKMDIDPRSTTIWSSDGEKIALISGHVSGEQDLLVAGKNGETITDYPVSPDSLQNYYPLRWSKCY